MDTTTFLQRFNGLQRKSNDQFTACCPAHEDSTPSLSITFQGERVLLHCHAGCAVENIVAEVGLTMQDLFIAEKSPKWQSLREHVYLDENGQPLAKKELFRKPDGNKTAVWYRYDCHTWRKGLGNEKPPLYNLPALLTSVDAVYLAEGEKDADTLAAMGYTATTAPNGAGSSWRSEWNAPLFGREVVVLADNDEAGRKHAERCANGLRSTAASVRVIQARDIDPNIHEKGDISDIVEKRSMEEARQMLEKAVGMAEQVISAEVSYAPKICCFSDVVFEETRFLVEPYFPIGKLTIVQGDSGTGKTAFMCAIAAAVSAGTSPFGKDEIGRNVLMLSVEDDPPILRGRIEADGGDLTRCFFLENVAGLSFNDAVVEQSVKNKNAGLLVFDPLQAFLGAKTDMFRANETRPILAALAEMAKRNDCAVVIISHMSKAQTKIIYKALGSVDIIAASRSVLYIGRDPDQPEQCAAVHIKSSNARPGQSIRFQIGDRGRVEWLGYCNLTADDLDRATVRKEAGIPYEQEPLVAVIRSIIAENPSGIFIAYDDLKSYSSELLNYCPFPDTQKLRRKVEELAPEVARKDNVRMQIEKQRPKAFMRHGNIFTPYSTGAARGIEISNCALPREFQCKLDQVAM